MIKTEFAHGEEVAYCQHCRTLATVITLTKRWETNRYAECGHIIPAYKIGGEPFIEGPGGGGYPIHHGNVNESDGRVFRMGGVPVVEDDGRYRPHLPGKQAA